MNEGEAQSNLGQTHHIFLCACVCARVWTHNVYEAMWLMSKSKYKWQWNNIIHLSVALRRRRAWWSYHRYH